jgi:ornithine carbamoyltransferase
MRHLLDIIDLSADELRQVLTLAAAPIEALGRPLDGQGAALVFEKPSNRTRHSMEMAVFQLGGHPIYTRGDEVGLDVREPVEDVARIMSGYHGLLAARVFTHSTVERFAAAASVPVINMLSNWSHPLQALADVATMTEVLGDLDGATVAYVGDHNNVSRSLAEACVMLGADVRLGCPDGYDASSDELERIGALGPGTITQVTDPTEAVRGAHVVHTDTWTSMGQESEKSERQAIFSGYRVDSALMSHAAPHAWFMHCLPAYRGFEVTADIIDGPQSLVIRQGHQRMHTARGVIAFLLGVRS